MVVSAKNRRFKFRSLAQRLSSITVKPLRENRDAPSSLCESRFYTRLLELATVDQSREFKQFLNQHRDGYNTLKQVLNNGAKLVDDILVAISNLNNYLAVRSLCSLLNALVIDIQQEFEVDDFERMFTLFASLIEQEHQNEPLVIETLFNCMAGIFSARKDVTEKGWIERVLDAFISAFWKPRRHSSTIQRLSCEAFAVLLRKHKYPATLVKKLRRRLRNGKWSAIMVFEIIKNVNGSIRTAQPNSLKLIDFVLDTCSSSMASVFISLCINHTVTNDLALHSVIERITLFLSQCKERGESVLNAVSQLNPQYLSNPKIRGLVESCVFYIERSTPQTNSSAIVQFISMCLINNDWIKPFHSRLMGFIGRLCDVGNHDLAIAILRKLSFSSDEMFRKITHLLNRSSFQDQLIDCVSDHALRTSTASMVPYLNAGMDLGKLHKPIEVKSIDHWFQIVACFPFEIERPDFSTNSDWKVLDQLGILLFIEANSECSVNEFIAQLSGPFRLKALKLANDKNEEIDFNKNRELILKHVQSPCHMDRLLSLELLNMFEPSVVVERCLLCEMTPCDLQNDRKKQSFITNLHSEFVRDYDKDGIAIRYLLGALTENYTRLWDPIITTLRTYKSNELLWCLIFNELTTFVFEDFYVSRVGSGFAHRVLENFDMTRSNGRRADKDSYLFNLWKLIDGILEISEQNMHRVITISLKWIEENRESNLIPLQLGIITRFPKRTLVCYPFINPLTDLIKSHSHQISLSASKLLLTRILSIHKSISDIYLSLFEPNLKWNLQKLTQNMDLNRLHVKSLINILIGRLNNRNQRPIIRCLVNLGDQFVEYFIDATIEDENTSSVCVPILHRSFKLLSHLIAEINSNRCSKELRTLVLDKILLLSVPLNVRADQSSQIKQLQRVSLKCITRFVNKLPQYVFKEKHLDNLLEILNCKFAKKLQKCLVSLLTAISESINCMRVFNMRLGCQTCLIDLVSDRLGENDRLICCLLNYVQNNPDINSSLNLDKLIRSVDQKLIELSSGRMNRERRNLCERLIDLLFQFQEFINSHEYRQVLVNHIVHLLKHHRYLTENAVSSLLALLKGNVTDNDDFLKLIRHLSPLLSELKTPNTRIELFSLLAVLCPNEDMVKTVADLEALRADRIDEIDFEKRLSAHKRIRRDLYQSNSLDKSFLYILTHCLHGQLHSPEISIRTLTMESLTSLVNVLLNQPDLLSRLIGEIRTGIKAKEDSTHFAYIKIVRVLVKHSLADQTKFPAWIISLQILLNEDIEMDFFENITHIQLHRRLRALNVLSNKLNDLNDRSIAYFAKPIISFCIKNASLQEKAVDVFGQAIAHLPWSFQRRTLMGIMKTEVATDSLNNQILFSIARNLNVSDKSDDLVIKRLIALLYKLIFERPQIDNNARLRPSLALTLVRLLTQFPDRQVFDSNITMIVLRLIELLKSRIFQVRKRARNCLEQIALQLQSPQTVRYVISELGCNLTRGYERHVLVYTVNALMQSSAVFLKPGDLDECLETIVSLRMSFLAYVQNEKFLLTLIMICDEQ